MARATVLPKKYLVLFIATVVALIAGYTAFTVARDRMMERKKRQAFDNLTATSLSRIAELAVLEYRYTDVMELNRTFIVGGNSTSLVRFSGVVKAGIPDASRIMASFDQARNTVTITLPTSVLMENTIDVTTVRIWDIKRNLFVPISTELKLQELAMFKDKIASELEASGFLQDANQRSREVVSSLYAGFGADIIVRDRIINE